MPFTDAAKAEMLKKIVGETPAGIAVTHASLHTSAPNASGSNEVTGGTYTREAVSFAAVGSDNEVETDADAVFEVPAGTTVTHVGLWSASSGGTFMGSMAVSPSEAFGSAGTFTLNSGTTFTLSDS